MPEETVASSTTGGMEEKPCSSSAAESSGDVLEEAKKLIGMGNRHLVMGDMVSAVGVFQEACGMLAEKYGDTADECGEAFFLCGKALLELARMENTVLGNALEGVPEESSEDGEKQDDSKIESADNLDEKTRDELREQVYDAMTEDRTSAENGKEATGGNGETNAQKDVKAEGTGDLDPQKEEGKDMDTCTDEKKEEKDLQSKVEETTEGNGETKAEGTDDLDTREDAKEEGKDDMDTCTDEKKEEKDLQSKVEEEKECTTSSPLKNGDVSESTPNGAEEVAVAQDEGESNEAKSKVATPKEDAKNAQIEGVEEKDPAEKGENGEEACVTEEAMEEGKDDDDDDDDDDEDGEGNAEDKGSEDEEVGNLQLAWEMLEVAKVIYKRKESKEDQLMAAQIFLKLGEVGAESGNYSQSLDDFQECLALQLKHLPAHSRLLAETHYQLGMTFSYTAQYSQAIQHFSSSIRVIESRLDMLQKVIDKAEGADEAKEQRSELEELKQLLPDIAEKVEDAKESQRTAAAASEAIQHTLAGASTSSAFTGENGGPSPPTASQISVRPADGASSTKSASDISHLVRKKRKPEEESPKQEIDAKKPKQEATVNGNGDSTASNGNGVQKKEQEVNSSSVETSA